MNRLLAQGTRGEAGSVLPGRVLLGLLLWGIFFIRFPALVAIAFAAGTLLALHHIIKHRTVDRITALVLLSLGYWLASGLLGGALSPGMLATPSYYTNEGRVFVTYFAFVALSSCAADERSLLGAVRQLTLIAVAGLLLYAAWALAQPGSLSVGRAHNFGGFITSHTGTGTFYSGLCVFLTLYGRHTRSRALFLLGLACLLPVLGSGSRESLVALVAVLGWYLGRAASLRAVLGALALVAAIAIAMPRIAPHTFERTALLFEASTYASVLKQIEKSRATRWEPGQDKDLEGEEFNVLSRVLYWNYAIGRFLDSPLLGAGFGRFNDYYVHFAGVRGLYYFGVSAQNSPATLHAHNSYLQLLAETGLVGLAIMLLIWRRIWLRVAWARAALADETPVTAYYAALQGMIVFLLVAALFGHALGAPIDAMPALALIGVGVSYLRGRYATFPRAAVHASPDPGTTHGSPIALPTR